MKKANVFLLSASCVLSAVSCQPEPITPITQHVIDKNDPNTPVVLREGELSTFATLIEQANLIDFFNGTGPFTSFAPSNAAFLKFNQATLKELKDPKNTDELIDFINYHVILGTYLSKNMKTCTKRTVNGKNISIKAENGELWVNDAKVIKTDLTGPNGVTYVIDTVLIPK